MFRWPWSKKVAVPRQTIVLGGGMSRSMPNNSRAYAVEGYGQNVVVFRCIDIIAKALASIPLVLVDQQGEPVESHPVLDLLNNPNPTQSGKQLRESMTAFRLISGQSYLASLAVGATPGELWVVPPIGMQVVEPRKGLVPHAYVYDDGIPDHRQYWPVDPVTGACELLQWKTFNPMSPWFGMSPISAAATGVDQHNAAGQWNKNLLANNAAPSGALTTEQTLTSDQFAQLKAEVEATYQGAQNARRPMVLEGGMDWKQFSLSPQDMDWLNGKLSSAQDIAAAFGVPLQVVPLPGSQTFANFSEARLALYEDTVIPLFEDLAEALTNWLLPMFGLEGCTLRGDYDAIAALQGKRTEKLVTLNTVSFLTINEKREAIGYAKVDDPAADMVMVPAGQLPLGLDMGEVSPVAASADPASADPALIAGASAAGANVAATALNGAQVTSLVDVVQQVALGQLPASAAVDILVQAFPTMDPATIRRMIATAEKFTPDAAAAPAPALKSWRVRYDQHGAMIGLEQK